MLLGILERQVQGGRTERHRVVGAGHPEFREADQLRHPRFCEGRHPQQRAGGTPAQAHGVAHLETGHYEKLRLEVTEIARAKVMTVNSVPMEKGKANKEKGAHGKSPDAKEIECHSCGKKGHKKPDCLRRKADLEKAKGEGRPAVPPQSVHAVTHEVGYPSSSARGTRCALPAGRRASR